MYKNIFILLGLIVSFNACKEDSKQNVTNTTGTIEVGDEIEIGDSIVKVDKLLADAIQKTKENGLVKENGKVSKVSISPSGIPDPCKLVSPEWLDKNTSLTVSNARVKEGSKAAIKDNRSCFIQWDQDGDENAGILMSVMINPIPEEINDYPQVFMEAKRMDGETVLGSDKAYPYKVIKGLGEEGVLCYEASRAYFRVDNDYLFMIAFNLQVSETEMQDLTYKIGNQMLFSFNEIMKGYKK